MHFIIKKKIFSFLILVVFKSAKAQFTSVGSAVFNSCKCYTLTPNVSAAAGATWYNQQINLANSFDLVLEIELGCADANGADGMAFVLQNNGLSTIGTSGGNVGYVGINNSIAVLIDTYQNSSEGDPSFDHISINTNGNINHSGSNNLAGPVQAISGVDNIEDCAKHQLRVVWNATTTTLSAYIDGTLRVQTTTDIVNTIFGGNSNVYWGLTAGTGGLSNVQRFCTISQAVVTTNLSNNGACVNNPVQFSATIQSTFPIITYYWNFGDGTSSNTLIPPSHTYASPGTYIVKFAVMNADNCTSDTTTYTINVNPKPVASFIANDTCFGTPTLITSTASGLIANYGWLIDGQQFANSAIISTTNFTSGIHFVKHFVTSNAGCISDTSYGSFTVYPKPSLPSFNTQNVCSGASTTLSITNYNAALQYYWIINNAAPINGNTITNTYATGNYIVKVFAKNNFGCTSDTVTSGFSVLEKPIASIIINDTCAPHSTTMQTNAANAVYTQQWLINNTLVANTTSYTNTFAANNYIVQYIVQNTLTCADTAFANFTVYPKPSIPSFTTQNLCSGSNTTLSVNNFDATLQYYWIINNALPINSNSLTNFYTLGNYTVKLYAKNANNCTSDTAINTFSVLQKPIASIIINDTCTPHPITMQTNAANNNYSQQWFVNNAIVATTTSYSNTFVPGNYVVKYIVQNTPSCADTAFANFNVFPKPNVTVIAPTVCLGQSTNFTTTINNSPITIQNYNWMFHDGSTATVMNPSKLFNTQGSYTAKLVATTNNGCKSDTIPTVFIITKPFVNAGVDTFVLRNQPFTLQATGDIGNYLWQPSLPFVDPTKINPTATLSNNQQFIVQLTTIEGCIATDTIFVNVFDGGKIYMPTAFTPNNDGKNDILMPYYLGIKKLNYFKVYNRWGLNVFETQNLLLGWNGNYKNKIQPTGTYIYVISAIDYLGKNFFEKGTVAIIK